jgi:hypothetical protein
LGISALLHLLLGFLFASISVPATGPAGGGRNHTRHSWEWADGGGTATFYLTPGDPGELLTSVSRAPASEPFVAQLITDTAADAAEPQELPRQTAIPGGTPGTGSGNKTGSGDGSTGGGTSFFHIRTQAQKIVYVIDRSASMGKQGALGKACRELLASLQQLPPTALFQIIVYNSTAQPLLPQHRDWLAATAENRQRVAQALAQLTAEGSTRHNLALPLALSLNPEVIFFLTDADDLSREYLQRMQQHNRHRTVIHGIEVNEVTE